MRSLLLPPLAAALMLSACGANDTPKTAEEVQGAAARIMKPRAGQYRSTARLIDISVPGLPQAQVDQAKAAFAGAASRARTYCLSQAEVDKGFEEMTRKLGEGVNGAKCSFKKFDASQTTIDAQMNCTGGNGLNAQVAMNGTVAAEKQTMIMNMKQQQPGMPAAIKMTMEVVNERIGDCG